MIFRMQEFTTGSGSATHRHLTGLSGSFPCIVLETASSVQFQYFAKMKAEANRKRFTSDPFSLQVMPNGSLIGYHFFPTD